MRYFRNLLVLSVAAVGIAACCALFSLPPYDNRFSCMAQLWLENLTGLSLHHRPDHFTGTVRLWDERGNLLFQHPYLDGRRHGQWSDYSSTGMVRASCTYSNDQPWEGFCHFWEDKVWLGEYRAGKPWNGRLPWVTGTGETDWHSYIDGIEVSDEEYKRRVQIPATATVIGIHHTR